jgi:hypothetical protein
LGSFCKTAFVQLIPVPYKIRPRPASPKSEGTSEEIDEEAIIGQVDENGSKRSASQAEESDELGKPKSSHDSVDDAPSRRLKNLNAIIVEGCERARLTYLWLIIMVFLFMLYGLYTWGVYLIKKAASALCSLLPIYQTFI